MRLLACRFFPLWVCCCFMWRGFCRLRFCCRVFLRSVLLCGLLSVASCCLVVLLFVALCSSSVWCCAFSSLLGRMRLSCCLVVAGCSAFGSLVTSCPDLRYGLFFLSCRCPLFFFSLVPVFFLDCVVAVFFSSDVVSSSYRVLFFWFFFLFFLVLLFDGMVFLDFCFLVWFLLSFLKSAVHAGLPARRTAWPVLLQAMS